MSVIIAITIPCYLLLLWLARVPINGTMHHEQETRASGRVAVPYILPSLWSDFVCLLVIAEKSAMDTWEGKLRWEFNK
jgi:hypothetical protein